MFLDLLRTKKTGEIVSRDTKISACKAVTWRLLGTIDTMIISFIMTGNVKIAFSIGSFEVFTKMILYFIHEKVWAKWTK
ncbi:DUF2061 domain-containing protein [Flavobacterium sp. NRK F10]|uniref:DUF2061 domain-containing protein n=1 Tax=Flavobacterium sediminis TaxID=2201181 RepID=A0A2U8QTA7_9FLAO|nr:MULTISPECIES: DUF2061 domain-containing protein [Flavobacterium]AWM13075.1 hypothetical protein DI487_03795 [Flavobacterium sediminis]MCO6174232.1 DUF2061 domain-containing protein [Flavobacterium sp. NRK F10]